MNEIQEWSNHLKLNASKTTVQAYTYEIQRLAKSHPKTNLKNLKTSDLIAYLAKIQSEIASDTAKNARNDPEAGRASAYRAANALRSFYAFFGLDTAKEIKTRKPAKRIQRTLTREEANQLLYAIDTSKPAGKRNLALVATMIDTGLRASEICRLTTDRIDLKHCLIWSITKGNQERFAAISEETANFIAAWLANRPNYTDTSYIFVGLKTRKPFTADGLRTTFKRISQETGIKNLSPHVLRRSFATLSTLNGAPTRTVQEAGGWKQINQVIDYTKAITAEAIRPYLPISGIMRSPD